MAELIDINNVTSDDMVPMVVDDPIFYLEGPSSSNIWLMVSAVLTLVLLLVSLVFNLINLCSVWCPTYLQSYGYYHTLALFTITHSLFFSLRFMRFLDPNLNRQYGFDFPADYTEILGPLYESCLPYYWDVLICLLGFSMLLLAVMVLDCLTISCTRSRGCVKCCRSFYLLSAILLTVSVLVSVLIIKFKILGLDMGLSKEMTTICVYGIYLGAFIFIPSFLIVIFGTVNWVTDLNSTRALSPPKRTIRNLDHKLLILSIFVLLFFLVSMILEFSVKLQVFEDDQGLLLTEWASVICWNCTALLYGMYPLMFICMLGRYCCCSCCCDVIVEEEDIEET